MSFDGWGLLGSSLPTILAIALALASVVLTAWLGFRYQLRVAARSALRDGRKGAYIEGIEAVKKMWSAVELAEYKRLAQTKCDSIVAKIVRARALSDKSRLEVGGPDAKVLAEIEALKAEASQESHRLNLEMVSCIMTYRGFAGVDSPTPKAGWDAYGDEPSIALLSEISALWLRVGTSAESQFAAAQIMMRLEQVPEGVQQSFDSLVREMKARMEGHPDQAPDPPIGRTDWFSVRLNALGSAAARDIEALLKG